MKRWVLRLGVIVGAWVTGAWLAIEGAAYSRTHPHIPHARGLDVLTNVWRDFVASTTGMNSAVIFLILVAVTLIVWGVTKKRK